MQALIVSGADAQRAQPLGALLKAAGYARILVAGSGGAARRQLDQAEFDLVLICAPLPDEYGHELAIQLAESSTGGVVLAVRREEYGDIAPRVEPYGVLGADSPLRRPQFLRVLRMAAGQRYRLQGLHRENVKLHGRIQEIRLVDRAKCALIQYLVMTEPQAHRYIEKQAMDLRITRGQVAKNILKTYEN